MDDEYAPDRRPIEVETLHAVVEPRVIQDPGRDPLDSTGRRCVAESTRGLCHRRFDHAAKGDERHWCFQADGRIWFEWKDEDA